VPRLWAALPVRPHHGASALPDAWAHALLNHQSS
jgi:hypothetical protein